MTNTDSILRERKSKLEKNVKTKAVLLKHSLQPLKHLRGIQSIQGNKNNSSFKGWESSTHENHYICKSLCLSPQLRAATLCCTRGLSQAPGFFFYFHPYRLRLPGCKKREKIWHTKWYTMCSLIISKGAETITERWKTCLACRWL